MLLTHYSVLAYDYMLEYQRRGEYWEGIQPRPVSGFDIELLSASVDYSEPQSDFPTTNKLLLYLTTPAQIDLTVRELSPKQYYLMNRVKEEETWQQGFNSYQWSTETVLKPLNLRIEQLGIIARINRSGNQQAESVAPVIFYHSQYPIKINGYRFAFKVGSSAHLNYAIYSGENSMPLLERELGKKMGGDPFMITWDCSKAEVGNYELVVDGYLLQDNSPLHQSIKFHHQPDIKGKF